MCKKTFKKQLLFTNKMAEVSKLSRTIARLLMQVNDSKVEEPLEGVVVRTYRDYVVYEVEGQGRVNTLDVLFFDYGDRGVDDPHQDSHLQVVLQPEEPDRVGVSIVENGLTGKVEAFDYLRYDGPPESALRSMPLEKLQDFYENLMLSVAAKLYTQEKQGIVTFVPYRVNEMEIPVLLRSKVKDFNLQPVNFLDVRGVGKIAYKAIPEKQKVEIYGKLVPGIEIDMPEAIYGVARMIGEEERNLRQIITTYLQAKFESKPMTQLCGKLYYKYMSPRDKAR